MENKTIEISKLCEYGKRMSIELNGLESYLTHIEGNYKVSIFENKNDRQNTTLKKLENAKEKIRRNKNCPNYHITYEIIKNWIKVAKVLSENY